MMKIKTVMFTALLASSAIARADGDAEYKHGQAAMKAGRVHEACDAFAASDKTDPNADTELALAACYEQDGKPVAAARLYRGLAEKDANTERRKTSSEKVVVLEAKAAKLRILPSRRPDGLVIKVDGVQVPNTRTPEPTSTESAATYTCPMHPEVRSDKPGKCPKCGMELHPTPGKRGGP